MNYIKNDLRRMWIMYVKYRGVIERYEYNKFTETRKEMAALRDLDKEKEFIETLNSKDKKADADQYIWSYIIKEKTQKE